jgi:hypothetical protein
VLHPLARRHSMNLRHDRFKSDTADLVKELLYIRDEKQKEFDQTTSELREWQQRQKVRRAAWLRGEEPDEEARW